jgi:hypothetical protein
MQHLEGSGTPVLYVGRTVLKGQLLKLIFDNVILSYNTFKNCVDILVDHQTVNQMTGSEAKFF